MGCSDPGMKFAENGRRMNIKEFKEEIELKIKIAKKAKNDYCKKGDMHYEWNNGYICACEEILEELKDVKKSISISPDLIMTAEETHKSSLMAPSGFLLAWNEINEDEIKELNKDE